MATTTGERWTIYANLKGILLDGEALACSLHTAGAVTVVRRTAEGQFAVIAVNGSWARVAAVLPTLGRARAYLRAMGR